MARPKGSKNAVRTKKAKIDYTEVGKQFARLTIEVVQRHLV